MNEETLTKIHVISTVGKEEEETNLEMKVNYENDFECSQLDHATDESHTEDRKNCNDVVYRGNKLSMD